MRKWRMTVVQVNENVRKHSLTPRNKCSKKTTLFRLALTAVIFAARQEGVFRVRGRARVLGNLTESQLRA